tara:strand:- start:139985 stop:141592 length:1608 start_codon:yes stop_codon:yes gene_type:complete
MKKITFVFILFVTFLSAQETPYVQGEILVQLQSDRTPDLLSAENAAIQIIDAEQISRVMNIWRLKVSTEQHNEMSLLKEVNKNASVLVSQLNHKVQLRETTPNDPLFAQQWQYYQENDKDIDADLAWDVTTGGVNTDGNEIVVAIIDDGLNINHPDIIDNLYINTGEIPGDGIDNDGNGYIDDIYGWNVYSNSGSITGGGHGTPVTGIIGATGNNEIGVTGVNWSVKLMPIIGSSGNEATVIAAYDYALNARIKFNETNGNEGAFVVATNSSFGVDFGQPQNYPLWCAFFDTMGEHGILSCGATINGNVDVDVNGDVPTACPSEYLISVTNTNISDVKVTGAGYGLETIDLGAPGQGTFTTSLSNYGGFGGTSGATPHVTGTIALLYAAPCEAFTAISKDDPALAAMMVRDYILDGVDPNASLEGITVTGGRLNVNNAIQLLMGDCENLSVASTSLVDKISLYPNPTEGIMYVKTPQPLQVSKIKILSLDGREISTLQNSDITKVDISTLSKGVYILQIEFENVKNTIYKKIVKK